MFFWRAPSFGEIAKAEAGFAAEERNIAGDPRGLTAGGRQVPLSAVIRGEGVA